MKRRRDKEINGDERQKNNGNKRQKLNGIDSINQYLVISIEMLKNIMYTFFVNHDSKHIGVHFNSSRKGGTKPYEARTYHSVKFPKILSSSEQEKQRQKFHKLIESVCSLSKKPIVHFKTLQNLTMKMKSNITTTHKTKQEAIDSVKARKDATKYTSKIQCYTEPKKKLVKIMNGYITKEKLLKLLKKESNNLSFDTVLDLEQFIDLCLGKVEVKMFGKFVVVTNTHDKAKIIANKLQKIYEDLKKTNWKGCTKIKDVCKSQPNKGNRYGKYKETIKALLSLRD